MYFDFEDYRPDVTPVGRVISWREGVLLSIIAHLVGALVVLAWPRLFPYDPNAVRRVAVMPQEQQPRFVFVQPRVDTTAIKPPELSEASDKNRAAQAPEKAEKPANPLPFSRGNSPEQVEQDRKPEEVARGRGPEPDPGQEAPTQPQPQNSTRLPDSQSALLLPSNRDPQISPSQRPQGGLLGDALTNLRRTMQSEQFNNPQGTGGNYGPGIQFDTKGVEFGPWLRRFVEQVKRNWEPLIPPGSPFMKGHVVVTFNIHKDGTITELSVAAPSSIAGFNNAAYGAMRASNPTYPLPPEYPSDQVFFTVTFFYNEQPPQ